MKKLLFLASLALLFIACEKGQDAPSYRTGKELSVSGKTYIYIRDTLNFNPDGTMTRVSPLHGGTTQGTYTQQFEVFRVHLDKDDSNGVDGYNIGISYGDFIYIFGDYYVILP